MRVPADKPLDGLSEAYVHLRDLANVNTNQIMVVTGRIDANLLERSVRQAVGRIPLLRARPLRGPARLQHDAFTTSMRFVDCQETAGECDFADASFRRRLMAFTHEHRLDWRERPPVQVLLVHSASGDSSCVYLSTHHGVADARSDSLLLRMIIDHYAALSGARPGPASAPPLPYEALPAIRPDWYRPTQRALRWLRGVGSVAADMFLRDVGLRVPLRGSRWEGRAADPAIGELDFHHGVLPTQTVDKLTRVAQAHGVTINTVLCAALVRLLERADGTRRGTVRITCAVSLRRLIDRRYDRSFRNYLVPSKIRIRMGQPSAELLGSVHAAIGQARGDRQLSTELGRLESLQRVLRYPVLHGLARSVVDVCQGTNACYSNPGRIEEDFTSFGSPQHRTLQFVGFGCLVPPYDFILYTPTLNGRMQLDLVYRRAAFANVERDFVAPFMDELQLLLHDPLPPPARRTAP